MRNEAESEYEQMCAELDHLRECDKANRKLIAELEAREPLCRCADEVRCDYLKRIAELEAALTAAKDRRAAAQMVVEQQAKQIAELQALLADWCDYYTEGMTDEDIHNLHIDTLTALEDE